MKIAMVSEHASPPAAAGGVDVGGRHVQVEALARAVARAGHEVTVYTRRDARSLPDRVPIDDGVVVEHLTAGPAKPIGEDDLLPHLGELAAGLTDRLTAARPDLVHSHVWMSGLAALLATREFDVPVVHTFHALGVTTSKHQRSRDKAAAARIRLEQALARDAAYVIATSNEEIGELVRFGASRDRITVIPCGVDLGLFTPDGPVAERGARPRIVSVGRLEPRKGFDAVIRALAGVPDAELLIAGGPSRERLAAHPEARRLRQVAKRSGVADRVTLLGAIPRTDLAALLRSADVVACAPPYEPFGIVPLEAMACGAPVVATDVGGIRDTVVHGSTGLLVPPGRPEALAGALRQMLAEAFWREAYGTAGLDRARSRYSWDRVAVDTIAVYRQLLSEPVADAAAEVGELAEPCELAQ